MGVDASRTERDIAPLVSTVALAEAWRRGRQAWLASALRGCEVAPVTEALAQAAGVACGATGGRTLDAIIAATAAARGATLLTANLDDMHACRPLPLATRRWTLMSTATRSPPPAT